MNVFGMPTLLELKDIEDCAKMCKSLGLHFVEINMNLPQYQYDKIDAQKFLDIAKKYDIFYTIHLDENFDACEFNDLVAKAYLQTLAKTINIAKKLSVPMINMHLSNGVYFTMPDKKIFLYEQYLQCYLQKQVEFKEFCERLIGNDNIKICIENSDGFKNFHKKALQILMQSDVFGLTFDIGHNYGIGNIDEKIIMQYKYKLCHFHFHDGEEGKNHLALGTGEIDLLKYTNFAKKINSSIVLESKTIVGLKQSVDWCKKFF